MPRLSVIVLSRQRPALLALCLAALARQDHPDYEVVLVADPASLGVRPDLPLKRIAFDQPNIPAGRNLGLAAAAGEVVAFIDDDALALPGWARRLAAPFNDAQIMAAAGYTRGPDGLNWQVQAERVTPSGTSFAIGIDAGRAPWVALPADQGCPVSTLGTNCAFRRAALAQIGGFDPVFSYYLDESDVNMRLAARFSGALTAVVPGAEVIHGIAAGPIRAEAGVPLDLRDVGRSAVIFARRHGGALPPLALMQRRKLLRHMVAGRLDPFAVGPLMKSLHMGIAAGQKGVVPPWPRPLLAAPAAGFLPLRPGPRPVPALRILHGWYWHRHRLRDLARQMARAGDIACLLLLTPTALPHRLTLTPAGWWEQSGGLWGRTGPDPDPDPDPGPSIAPNSVRRFHLLKRQQERLDHRFHLAMTCRFRDLTRS